MTSYKIDRGILIPKAKIHPNPWNPNHMKAREQAAIEESITAYGQVMELLVRPHPDIPGEYQIIDGEHRYNALPDEVFCNVIHGLPDGEAKKLTIVMNETRGKADKIELAQLLADIRDEVEDLGNALPYDPTELEELISLTEVDWDSFSEDVGDLGSTGEEQGSGETGEWKHFTVKIPNDAFDVLQQATDLIKEQRELNGDPAIAWGQVIEALAAEYLALP